MNSDLTLRKVDALLRWLQFSRNFVKNVDDHLIVCIVAIEELRERKLTAQGKNKNIIEIDYQNFIDYCSPYVGSHMVEALKHSQITDFRKTRTKGRAVCYLELERNYGGVLGAFNKKTFEKFMSDFTGFKVQAHIKEVLKIEGGLDEIAESFEKQS
jgi:hypothetical protein